MDGVIDTSKTYAFISRLTGPGLVLAVSKKDGNGSNTTLSMANATEADANGQWFLTRVNGNQPGVFYRVHAASLGVAQSMDVVNEGGAVTSTRLKMAASGDNSGQAWRFDKWTAQDSDGYRLSNKMSGPDIHLDVASGTFDAQLFGGDFPGQHWTLSSIGGASPPPDDGSEYGGGTLLSMSGVVGLSVVSALGFGLLIFGSLFWFVRSRARRRRRHPPPAELGGGPIERKDSVQSFESGHHYGSRQMREGPSDSHQEVETISPASSLPNGSIGISRSNTTSTGSTGDGVVTELGVPPVVAELPDRKY